MRLMRWIPFYAAISGTMLVIGIASMMVWGFQFAIDFTGGSLLVVKFTSDKQPTQASAITEKLSSVYSVGSVQPNSSGAWVIKGAEISQEAFVQVQTMLTTQFGTFTLERFDSVGPTVSSELISKTLLAIAIVAGIIMLYVGKQFHELKWGVSAVLAMLHDSLVLLGAFSLLGHFLGMEVDVLFVSALLTSLSFSVHDTIVVFHRIRELQLAHPREVLVDVCDAAITETMPRSINNSVTIIIMLLALVLLGGETLRPFSIALLIGAITGTYSSPFVAVPLMLWFSKMKRPKFKFPLLKKKSRH